MGFGKLVIGSLFVAVGLVLFAAHMGFLPLGVTQPLLQLWPLLLVAFGVAFLANALKSPFLGWFAALIVIGGVGFGVFLFTHHGSPNEPRFASSIDLDKAHVESLTLRTETLGGRLEVGSAAVGKGRALALEVIHVPGEAEAAHVFRASGKAGILIWPAQSGFSRLAPVGAGLHVTVPDGMPLRVDGRCHFSFGGLDLTHLRPERVAMRLVASSLDLRVGDRGRPAEITIRGYLSTARLRIPGDCPVRLSFSSRFTTRSVPSDFFEHAPGRGKGATFTSEGRGAPIRIRVEGPLLHVAVEREPLSAV